MDEMNKQAQQIQDLFMQQIQQQQQQQQQQQFRRY
jgi:hypothetical protein